MNELKLNAKEVEKLYKNNELIGFGTSSKIILYDNDTLMKLYYQKFCGNNLLFEYFLPQTKCNIADITFHGYHFKNAKNLKRLKKLISRQKDLKYTKLPLGIVTINNYLIGSLLHYFKEYVVLPENFKYMSIKERKEALEVIREKLTELQQNYIYPRDLWTLNVLIHPTTKDIELIDLDDSRTVVTNCYDRQGLRISNNAFNEMCRILKKY